jgi:transcriptional regulator of acetoin/glycerol metabolism
MRRPAKTTRTCAPLSARAIDQAVHALHDNVSEAARRLGISRNTLYRKLAR